MDRFWTGYYGHVHFLSIKWTCFGQVDGQVLDMSVDRFWTGFGHVRGQVLDRLMDRFWTCRWTGFGHVYGLVLDMLWTGFGHVMDRFLS